MRRSKSCSLRIWLKLLEIAHYHLYLAENTSLVIRFVFIYYSLISLTHRFVSVYHFVKYIYNDVTCIRMLFLFIFLCLYLFIYLSVSLFLFSFWLLLYTFYIATANYFFKDYWLYFHWITVLAAFSCKFSNIFIFFTLYYYLFTDLIKDILLWSFFFSEFSFFLVQRSYKMFCLLNKTISTGG